MKAGVIPASRNPRKLNRAIKCVQSLVLLQAEIDSGEGIRLTIAQRIEY